MADNNKSRARQAKELVPDADSPVTEAALERQLWTELHDALKAAADVCLRMAAKRELNLRQLAGQELERRGRPRRGSKREARNAE